MRPDYGFRCRNWAIRGLGTKPFIKHKTEDSCLVFVHCCWEKGRRFKKTIGQRTRDKMGRRCGVQRLFQKWRPYCRDSTPFLVCLFMPCSSIPEMDGLFGLFHSFLYAQSAGRLLIPGWGRSHQASCSYPTLFSHPLPLQSFVPLGTTDAWTPGQSHFIPKCCFQHSGRHSPLCSSPDGNRASEQPASHAINPLPPPLHWVQGNANIQYPISWVSGLATGKAGASQ